MKIRKDENNKQWATKHYTENKWLEPHPPKKEKEEENKIN
jgi:hypothetical protein